MTEKRISGGCSPSPVSRQRGFRGRIGFLVLLLASSLASVARAQLYTGTVTGVVSDPSGAVVPGAPVQLMDEQKGFVFRAITDVSGNYLFRSLPPGSYELSVQATGFKSETRSGIILEVNHNVTVNLQLQVGATNQTVEVKGQAPLLDAQDAVTGQVVDRTFINDLPLVGRSLSDLVFLTAGVTELDATSRATHRPPVPMLTTARQITTS